MSSNPLVDIEALELQDHKTKEVTVLPKDVHRSNGDCNEEGSSSSVRRVSRVVWILVVFSILSSILLYALDNTITADVIPVVVKDFGSSDKLAWLPVGFLIGGVSMTLPNGRLYGLYNAKTLYICSVILFMIGSALCGAAPNINAFIVGRVIAGAGGNGMYIGVMTLLSVNTNDQERPMYLGLCGLVFGIGMVAGPVIGGAFAQSAATWRWSFYLNLCVGAVFAPVYVFLLPGFDPRGNQNALSRFYEFDFVGTVLSIGSLVSLIMALNFGGTLYPWKSGQIIALFVVAGVLGSMFGLQQVFTYFTDKTKRLLPVSFLRNKEAVLLFIAMIVGNVGGFIPLYYISTYFQFTRGDDPLHAAVRLLPFIVFVSLTVLLNGIVMAKFGYYLPWYVVGNILALAGAALLSTMDVRTPTAQIYGFEILLGVGSGAFAQAGYAVIQAVVDPSMRAYGITFMMLAQQFGIAIGLSVAGALFVNLAINDLQQVLPGITGSDLESAILGTSGNFFTTLQPKTKAVALTAIVNALKKIFIPSYVAFAVGLCVSIFLSRRNIHSAS